jgi:hypothetical protein
VAGILAMEEPTPGIASSAGLPPAAAEFASAQADRAGQHRTGNIHVSIQARLPAVRSDPGPVQSQRAAEGMADEVKPKPHQQDGEDGADRERQEGGGKGQGAE